MAVDRTPLEQYRQATEALLDALTAFQSRNHTRHGAEYQRLQRLIEECQADMDSARREFENPEALNRSG
jgi:hypothetical protein